MLKLQEQVALSRRTIVLIWNHHVKLETRATSLLSDKFTLLSLGDNYDQLAIAYSMTMRLVEMTKHFKRFDPLDVFT